MDYFVGISLALLVGLFATVIGFDRDRAFYPVVTIVIASYYELFGLMGGSKPALDAEAFAFAVFIVVSVIGFKTSLWLIVGALAGHGLFDFVHSTLITNPGVPAWWPNFCLSYDLVAASYLAWRLASRPSGVANASAGDNTAIGWRRVMTAVRGQMSRHVQIEIDAADALAKCGDFPASFRHLERAHVLSQSSTWQHVRVHWHMLVWGVRQHDVCEIIGQTIRILGAATKTAFGLVPRGNTGGANVSPFRAMPIPDDLAALMVKQPARTIPS